VVFNSALRFRSALKPSDQLRRNRDDDGNVRDRGARVVPVPADDVGKCLAAEVREQPDPGCPEIPPTAFQTRNRGHDIPARPATQAIVSRNTATKRPKKTARPP
jgi:hypothetical protein